MKQFLMTVTTLTLITGATLKADEPPLPGPYLATVSGVYDGDTFYAKTQIWIGQVVATAVRINRIDTPEIKGQCAKEVTLAGAARDRVAQLTTPGVIYLRNIRLGKYAGRVLADVTLSDGRDLASVLLNEKLARAYDGGKRQSWCD